MPLVIGPALLEALVDVVLVDEVARVVFAPEAALVAGFLAVVLRVVLPGFFVLVGITLGVLSLKNGRFQPVIIACASVGPGFSTA